MNFFRFCLFLLSFPLFSLDSHGAEDIPPELQEKAGIAPRLGSQIDLNTRFTDSQGKERELGEYFDGKHPVALLMSYYSCPMLCGVMINGAKSSFRDFDWTLGERYRVVTVSINPKEKAELARAKKENVFKDWPMDDKGKNARSFLVGEEKSSRKLADELGFSYTYVPETKEYAHGAGIFFLSPTGKVTRFLPGIVFEPLDIKLSFLEASEGKVTSFVEKLLMFCYNYSKKDSKYTLFVSRLMKLGGALIVLMILGVYGIIFFNRRKMKKA